MSNEEFTRHPMTPEADAVPGESAEEGTVVTEPRTAETNVEESPRVERQWGPPSPPENRPTRSGLSPWLAALLALLLVVASSAVTYWVASNDDDTAAVPETASEEPPAIETTETLPPGEEPVAAAAEVILPSVVQIRTDTGVGSGVIYDSDGLILTAAHVVRNSRNVIVRFADGEQVEGTVVGGTIDADVAVVEVDRTGLPAAELALDDEPEVGQMAIAVGSPWGLEGTVTAGIISAVDQVIPTGDGGARAVLQTDAAINPGNSGGPLVDRQGRVIGINVSIFSTSGTNAGVGFAVPIDEAHSIAERVVAGEEIHTAFLGVTLQMVDTGRAGAVIREISPDSPAEEAGLEEGDLVVSIDGAPVKSPADLAAQVRSLPPGSTVDVVIIRDDEEMTVPVTLVERPE